MPDTGATKALIPPDHPQPLFRSIAAYESTLPEEPNETWLIPRTINATQHRQSWQPVATYRLIFFSAIARCIIAACKPEIQKLSLLPSIRLFVTTALGPGGSCTLAFTAQLDTWGHVLGLVPNTS